MSPKKKKYKRVPLAESVAARLCGMGIGITLLNILPTGTTMNYDHCIQTTKMPKCSSLWSSFHTKNVGKDVLPGQRHILVGTSCGHHSICTVNAAAPIVVVTSRHQMFTCSVL
jgi:hypothetical protein